MPICPQCSRMDTPTLLDKLRMAYLVLTLNWHTTNGVLEFHINRRWLRKRIKEIDRR
jgi:hypothetical protein